MIDPTCHVDVVGGYSDRLGDLRCGWGLGMVLYRSGSLELVGLKWFKFTHNHLII